MEYVAQVAAAMRSNSKVVASYYVTLAKILSVAFLSKSVYDDVTKKNFNKDVKEAAGESYDRVPLSKIWACLFFFGDEIATAWANGNNEISVQELYSEIPRASTSKSLIEKLELLLNRASLSDIENMLDVIHAKRESVETAQKNAQSRTARENEVREKILAQLLTAKVTA